MLCIVVILNIANPNSLDDYSQRCIEKNPFQAVSFIFFSNSGITPAAD
jgi:hypothetical protein